MSDPTLDNCTAVLSLKIRRSELHALNEKAGDKSITAYVRERLGLDPPPPKGRRWPENPQDRQWRKTA
jgi:hypothetical protein